MSIKNAFIQELDWPEWLCVVFFATVLIGLVLNFFLDIRAILNSPTAASWASAIGTFLAAAAAVGVATWTHCTRKAEKRLEGALLISGERNHIGLIMAQIYPLRMSAAEYSEPNPDPNATREQAALVLRMLKSISVPTAAAFDPTYAMLINSAKGTMHALTSIADSKRFCGEAATSAIARLNDCIKRCDIADAYIKRRVETS